MAQTTQSSTLITSTKLAECVINSVINSTLNMRFPVVLLSGLFPYSSWFLPIIKQFDFFHNLSIIHNLNNPPRPQNRADCLGEASFFGLVL